MPRNCNPTFFTSKRQQWKIQQQQDNLYSSYLNYDVLSLPQLTQFQAEVCAGGRDLGIKSPKHNKLYFVCNFSALPFHSA
jgi:hypothetical protein